jgi:hypothetical protein
MATVRSPHSNELQYTSNNVKDAPMRFNLEPDMLQTSFGPGISNNPNNVPQCNVTINGNEYYNPSPISSAGKAFFGVASIPFLIGSMAWSCCCLIILGIIFFLQYKKNGWDVVTIILLILMICCCCGCMLNAFQMKNATNQINNASKEDTRPCYSAKTGTIIG